MVYTKNYYVYILTNKKRGVLYIGVTNDLLRRMDEHRQEVVSGFTKKYHLKKLVHYEATDDINRAIEREKQLKNWHRQWKINLIEKENPNWQDLYDDLI
ncbi:MAG: GIY-YIG nuclease family protein [Candidatus Doudnabacteria bacterium]